MRIIVDRGSNAGAILSYLHRVDKREAGKEQEDPVFYTNMFGRNAQERTEELRFSSDQNSKVEKTFVHYKISYPPGENPDLENKKAIVDDLLEARNHGKNCQFLAIEHFEKIGKHDVHHLHILASTVRLDGSWVDDSYERVKLKAVEREIEIKRGLQYCPPKPAGERQSDPIREFKMREHLKEQGKTLTKDTLRAAIDQAVADAPSMPLLVARLKGQGYSVQFHEFADGKGISYAAAGRPFAGRNLGDRYSFNGLHEYAGVSYEPERDDPLLRELNQMDSKQCQTLWKERSDNSERPSQPELIQVQPGQELQQQIQIWDATRLVRDIWQHSRDGRPKLKTATFGNYKIQVDAAGEPELYRDGEKVLARAEDEYQDKGISPSDVEHLQAWQRLTLQQHEERAQAQAQEEAKKQQAAAQKEQSPEKSGGVEL